MKLERCAVGFLLAAALLTAGCGGGADSVPTGSLSGKLLVSGNPLPSGQINFTSATSGTSGFADLQGDGSYAVAGELPAADYKVFVTQKGLGDTPPSEDGNPELTAPLDMLPQKYQSESTTDVTITVKEGKNTFDFDWK